MYPPIQQNGCRRRVVQAIEHSTNGSPRKGDCIPLKAHNNLAVLIVTLLILLGFGLRLYHIDKLPYRGDEAFTIRHWVNEPLSDTLKNVATVDPHPPLAYALFRGWGQLFSDDEFIIRLLPALLNLLGIAALYALGKRIGGRAMGLIAALLWTLHPFQIWHAQDARNYAIWAGLSATGIWLALRAVEKRRLIDWGLYIIAGALAAYVYYLELFVLFSLNVYVLISYRHERSLLKRWIVAQVLIALILAPWYLQERLISGGGYTGTTGNSSISKLFTWFLPTLTFGSTLPQDITQIIWPLILVSLIIGGVLLYKQRMHRHVMFLIAIGVIPAILLSIVASRINVFTPRYILASSPAYLLLFVGLVIGVKSYRQFGGLRRFVPLILIVGWLGVALISLNNYYNNAAYAKSPGWDLLSEYLAHRVVPNDVIIQASADDAFDYYYERDELSARLERIPASPNESEAAIINRLQESSNNRESLWLIAQTNPDWPNAGIVERWLEENMQLVRKTSTGNLRIEQYMRPSVDASDYAGAPIATFEATAALVGADVLLPAEPTNELNIHLYWQPTQTTTDSLKVFVHLTGDMNPATNLPLWSQDDQFPLDGRIETTTWDVNTIYRDVYTLPLSDVPAGTYQLVVGFYHPETGERVMTTTNSDSAMIAEITLP
ncbi:MAG: hypothetical protein D6737_03890 [Chloroflexi bacterium]|nr:MAG: hypothetical protein D6737_03890 [Chloroflexota bacterium]